ncbi:MAG TPA: 2-C-methyl-D-erythritol 4-phosphate cytidylyltransferase [Gemmatimonadales bacterium]|nr:2-C-methyl-D-erythritol 4-phosphate cytidylyltransferase [Gemmatimonadales bacterium]
MPRDVGAIVVAAGQGLRFGAPTPKQYQLIGGIPMVLRALRPFASHPEVAQVVLVLPPEDAAQPPRFLSDISDFSHGSDLSIVPGGEHRCDSVRAGLAALGPECEIVLVHDGARPFVQRGVIDAVIRLARRGEGAIAAVPVNDTLKEAAAAHPDRVERTVARERLWRAQTPQGFPRGVLERAHETAPRDANATDDAAMVERIGVPVRLVPDSIRNMKITTPDDLALAELLARKAP